MLLENSNQEFNKNPPELRLPQSLLDKLWIKMSETYGYRWTSQYGRSAGQDHAWAIALKGMNGNQLANGMIELFKRSRDFPWPPTSLQFKEMCLLVPDLPNEGKAWNEALMQKYTHPAVKIAANATGIFDLRRSCPEDKQLRDVFAMNYAIVTRRVQLGESLDEPMHLAISNGTTEIQRSNDHAEAVLSQRIKDQKLPPGAEAFRLLIKSRTRKCLIGPKDSDLV